MTNLREALDVMNKAVQDFTTLYSISNEELEGYPFNKDFAEIADTINIWASMNRGTK